MSKREQRERIEDWQLLTSERVAQLLGTTPGVLNQLRYRREGPPYYHLGRRVVYKEREVMDWLREHLSRGGPVGASLPLGLGNVPPKHCGD